MKEARPFIKWAGGKRQLLDELTEGLPDFENFHEPFLGGGAFFFKLSTLNLIKKAYLSDFNPELVNTYKVVKNDVEVLIEMLSSGKYKNKKECYYAIRAEKSSDKIKRAARFIYLNKTAFNGLYRVNSKGDFNVPFGRYEDPMILDTQNLRLVHKALQKDGLACTDFEVVLKNAKKGDLVYFDPPYVPVSKTASFTAYRSDSFSEEDQERLFRVFKKLDTRGCHVMLSNSYTDFTAELYKGFNEQVVYAARAISCKAEGRGKIRELIVRNWIV